MKRKLLLIPVSLLLLAVLAFWFYISDYYRADERALRALESDTVQVTRTEYGWFFDGPATDRALVFYPGGKVEETAYAPLLHRLAESDMDVCLLSMPFRLAVFDTHAADRVREGYDYAHWYIAGHSLGGAMAASYAADRSLDGVILLSAYPTRAVEEPMLLLYGTEDGVLNRERVDAAVQYGSVEIVPIQGGNHAGFGDYGAQQGDHDAEISAEEQQRVACEEIHNWLAARGR